MHPPNGTMMAAKRNRAVLGTLNVVSGFGPEHKAFNLTTHAVCDLYRSCLGRLHTDGIRKVVVHLRDLSAPPGAQRTLVDVLFVEQRFDFTAYWSGDTYRRKEMVLEVLDQTMQQLAVERGWDMVRIRDAMKGVLDRRIENVQYWRRPKRNPSGRVQAQVLYTFDADAAKVFIVFTTRAGRELQRDHVLTLPPVDYFLHDALGTLRWEDERTVVLESRLGNESWRSSLTAVT